MISEHSCSFSVSSKPVCPIYEAKPTKYTLYPTATISNSK